MLKLLKKQRGFTLTELIIVLVIAGILLAVVTFNWSIGAMTLNAEAEQLVSNIRYMQFLAMTEGSIVYGLNFSSSSYSFRDIVDAPITHLSYGASSVTLENGTVLTTSGLPNGYILFDSAGTPYTDTSLTELSSTATVTLTNSDGSVDINIVPETGFAYIA